LTKAIFSPNLVTEMYQLASIMVPGGADRLLKGKPRQDGRIRKYLPFILQELPGGQDSIYSAPVIPDQGRPQTDEPGTVGLAK